jgi:hypothetical protein
MEKQKSLLMRPYGALVLDLEPPPDSEDGSNHPQPPPVELVEVPAPVNVRGHDSKRARRNWQRALFKLGFYVQVSRVEAPLIAAAI